MAEKVLMKGNEALAEAALRAGCRFFFGYPITPQTELAAYMSKRMPKVGGTFLQAESEIAAINMVYGASAAGARVMTSSSSPGISLKGEGISYMAGADLPGVIINVQRGGPGLGGIQPSQADYWQATRALGHGDFRVVVYAPSTVQEMADLAFTAFDVADQYRTPVMILADGMLGQMMEPVVMPEPVDSLPEKPWAACGHKHQRPHNVVNSLYLTADDACADMDAYATAQVLAPMVEDLDGWDVVLVGDGSADLYAKQTGAQLAARLNVPYVAGAIALEEDGGSLKVRRKTEDEVEVLSVPLPAVVSVLPEAAAPRIPGMKDILAAGKKPMEAVALAEAPAAALEVVSCKAPVQAERAMEVYDATDDGAVEKFAAALKAAL